MADRVFEYINGIMEPNHKYEEDLGEYDAFLTSRALSLHPDTIMWANEINQYQVPDQLHYDYFFHAIRKMRRRFSKWPKKIRNAEIQLVMDYHQVDRKKAESYLPLLTDEQLDIMKKRMEIGG